MPHKKIVLFIIDLNSGGAEWQMARLAENARDYLIASYSHAAIRDAYFRLYESLDNYRII